MLKFGTCPKFNKTDFSANVRIRINKAELEMAIPEGKGQLSSFSERSRDLEKLYKSLYSMKSIKEIFDENNE